MVRQDIVINNYKYIVDIYKAETSDLVENRKTKFVMLRNYEFSNNIIVDKDIYVIEKSLLEEYIQNYKENNNTNNIVFPHTNNLFTNFSTEFTGFNDNYSVTSFINNDFDKYNLYKINEDNEIEEALIPCDKVRIYHPHHKKHLKAIVYFDNYINNVHFHWFCRTLESISQKTYADNTFTIDNIHYSEYVEFWMPSIEKIISKDIFYIENLNDIEINDLTIDSKYSSLIHTVEKKTEDNKTIIYKYVSNYIFTLPYKIETYKIENDENEISKKIFLPQYKQTVINNYIAFPVNITIYPYTEITQDNFYLEDTDLLRNSDTFYSDISISLSSKMGFDNNGIISVINKFNYPNKEQFDSFKEAYQYYYDVDLDDYTGIIYVDDEEDYNEDEILDEKQCGFELSIFKDYNHKYRIYKSYFELDNPKKELDDFAFNMTNIFQNWEQLPDFLICQTRFIDKYLGHVITGNQFIITKEWFKYMINDTNPSTYKIKWENEQTKLNTISDMDLKNINFIDKINCIIKSEQTNNNTLNYNTKNSPRVIYKPVFYKTYDLQNLQLKPGFVQNIGINLSEYMTKVESFSLIIGTDINLIEYARNDVYVIFRIDTNDISEPIGQYHITNQDGEYISSGKYTIS